MIIDEIRLFMTPTRDICNAEMIYWYRRWR